VPAATAFCAAPILFSRIVGIRALVHGNDAGDTPAVSHVPDKMPCNRRCSTDSVVNSSAARRLRDQADCLRLGPRLTKGGVARFLARDLCAPLIEQISPTARIAIGLELCPLHSINAEYPKILT